VAVCTANGDVYSPVPTRLLRLATPEEIKSFDEVINQRIEDINNSLPENLEDDDVVDWKEVTSDLPPKLDEAGFEKTGPNSWKAELGQHTHFVVHLDKETGRWTGANYFDEMQLYKFQGTEEEMARWLSTYGHWPNVNWTNWSKFSGKDIRENADDDFDWKDVYSGSELPSFLSQQGYSLSGRFWVKTFPGDHQVHVIPREEGLWRVVATEKGKVTDTFEGDERLVVRTLTGPVKEGIDDADELRADDVQSVEAVLPDHGYSPVEQARAEGFDFEGGGWVRRLPGAKVFISAPNAIGERTAMYRGDGPELWRKQMTDVEVMDMLNRVKTGVRESDEEPDWKDVTPNEDFSHLYGLIKKGGWIEEVSAHGARYARRRYSGENVVHAQRLVPINLSSNWKLYDNDQYVVTGPIEEVLAIADDLWSKSSVSESEEDFGDEWEETWKDVAQPPTVEAVLYRSGFTLQGSKWVRVKYRNSQFKPVRESIWNTGKWNYRAQYKEDTGRWKTYCLNQFETEKDLLWTLKTYRIADVGSAYEQ
jgi:hypothetical protein